MKISKDAVLTTLGEVYAFVIYDKLCSQDFAERMFIECEEIVERGNKFNLIRNEEDLGYILDEYENYEDEPVNSKHFLFDDYQTEY